MLKIFLFLTMLLPSAQSDAQTFYIVNVEAFTKYDSSYIFERASAIVPPDKLVRQSDIDCLVNELKASGIFEDVKTELIPIGANTRKLILTATYHRRINSFLISEVTLKGVPYANELKFQSELKKRGIKPKIPFLKYYFGPLEEKINGAFRKALPQNLANSFSGRAWITIRPISKGKIKLIVSSPDNLGCSASIKR